jgi:hypothetical protein
VEGQVQRPQAEKSHASWVPGAGGQLLGFHKNDDKGRVAGDTGKYSVGV